MMRENLAARKYLRLQFAKSRIRGGKVAVADLERGGARGREPSLFSTNLIFFNVKLRPKSVDLKILCKRAPSFFKTCIRHWAGWGNDGK